MSEPAETTNGDAPAVDPAMLLTIPQAGLQRIADYLQTRPWGEVNELIGILVAARPLPNRAARRAKTR